MPKDINALLKEHKEAVASGQAIVAAAKADNDRELTEDEATQFDASMDKADELGAEIAAAEVAEKAAIARQDRLTAAVATNRAASLEPRLSHPSPLGGNQLSSARTTVPAVAKDPGERPFATFGAFLDAVRRAEGPGAYVDPRLTEQAAASGLGEDVPSLGGFLVQKDDATDILSRAYTTGEILSRVRRIPIGPNSNGLRIPYVDETSRATGSRWGGVRAYWMAEGVEKTASHTKYGQLELALNKVACLGYITDELIQDTTAMDALLTQAFAEELAFVIEDSFIRGTGAGQPLGILNAPCLVSVAEEATQAAGTFRGNNALEMWKRLDARSRSSAVWLHNQDVETDLWSMSAYSEAVLGAAAAITNTLPMVIPHGVGFNKSEFPSLFGRPLIPTEYCSTVGTQGDVILADFSQYLVIDKGGAVPASSMHVRFIYDEMCFRLVYRIDGQPWWPAALTPYQGTNTTSPFVVCDTRV